VGNPFLVCQELVDVLAMGMEQILAISDSSNHGIEFIRIKGEKETGKADEIEKVLPKATRGRNR